MTVTEFEGYQIIKSGWVEDPDFAGVDPYPYSYPHIQRFYFCREGSLLPSLTLTLGGDVDEGGEIVSFEGSPQEWDNEGLLKAALDCAKELSDEQLRAIEDCWKKKPVVFANESWEYRKAFLKALEELDFFKELKKEVSVLYQAFQAAD